MFQGLGVTLVFSVPASAVYLSTYDAAKQKCIAMGYNPHSIYVHSAAAVAAEGLSSVLFTPMEVMKQKLQVYEVRISTAQIASQVYQKHGLGGFYRGYWLTQGVFVPYTITYFVSYEKLKKLVSDKREPNETSTNASNLSFWKYLLCSSTSALLAAAISTPLDVIKTRVQIKSNQPALSVATELFKENGIRSFTKGMGARIAWAAPSMTICVTIFELLKDLHAKTNQR